MRFWFLAAVVCGVVWGNDWNFNELSHQAGQSRSIEELLCRLPVEYRENYVRLFDSRSLQGATLETPRLLLFGATAKLVVAVTGAAELPGGRVVEAMEFNDRENRFHFHEIQYSAHGEAIVRRDVPKCLVCHGQQAAPRWDPYSFWPGAFGTADDDLTQYRDSAEAPASRERSFHRLFEQRRRRERQGKTGRYQCLENLAASYGGAVRPNLQLGQLLSAMNVRRIAQTIKDDPDLFSLRFAIAAASQRFACHGHPSFFTVYQQGAVANATDRLQMDIARVNGEAVRAKFARYKAATGEAIAGAAVRDGETYDYFFQPLAELRFLVDGFSRHHLVDWSLEATSRSYDFGNTPSIDVLTDTMREIVFHNASDTELLTNANPFEAGCAGLRAAHLMAFPDNAANRARVQRALERFQGLGASTASVLQPFQRCVQCHLPDNDFRAPVIPFENPAKLAQRFDVDFTLRGKIVDRLMDRPASGKPPMPPNGALTNSEREAMSRFLTGAP